MSAMQPKHSVLTRILIFYALCFGCCSQLEHQLFSLRKQNEEIPDSFEIMAQLAAVLHQLDHAQPDGGSRVPEAEWAYRRGIELAPNGFAQSTLMGNLGALLLSAGRLPEALLTLDESIQLGLQFGHMAQGNTAGAIFNKGKVLSAIGKEESAQEMYRQALTLAEGTAPSTWTKCCAAIKKPTLAELKSMEGAAAFFVSTQGKPPPEERNATLTQRNWLHNTPPHDQCWLFFALYAAYQSKGLHQKAWDALIMGNKLQKDSQGGVSGLSDDRLLLGMRAAFPLPSQLPERNKLYETLLRGVGGHWDETPIFIVGMPRSGSTLIEQILASHPKVEGAGEDTALAPLIPRLIQVLASAEQNEIHLDEIASVGREYVTLMRNRLANRGAPSRIVDKMLHNAWNVGYIAFMLPKAHIIWAVRHPLDVVLSCFAQPFEGRGTAWAWDMHDIAHQLEMMHHIMMHWQKLLPGRILKVSYESLVFEQERTSREILKHSNLDWDPAVLHFHKTDRHVQTASQFQDHAKQVRQSLYFSSVGKWKQYADPMEEIAHRLQNIIKPFEQELAKYERSQPVLVDNGQEYDKIAQSSDEL